MRVLFMMCLSLCCVNAGELRVASYNIHHGAGLDKKLDLKRIAEVLKKHQPDFVALQEVDHMTARTGNVDQAAVLAKHLGMTAIFRKSMKLGKGGYGNAILSKYPILETHVHKLTGGGEPRTALEIICEVDGKKVSFLSVHLDHQVEDVRVGQVNILEKALSIRKHPMILVGDFNAKPPSKTMKLLSQTWSIVPKTGPSMTFPANQPSIEIDYMLTRGFSDAKTKTKANSRVGDEKVASDHRPLFGVLPW